MFDSCVGWFFFSRGAEKKLNLVQQVALISKSHSSILAAASDRLKDYLNQSDPLLVTKAGGDFSSLLTKMQKEEAPTISRAVAAINT